MRKVYFQAVDTLEALYFFTQSLEGQPLKDLTGMRRGFAVLGKKQRLKVLNAIKGDIKLLREHYGAKAANKAFRKLLAEARSTAKQGNAYLPKWFIDQALFEKYAKVFSRWPHVPQHAYVIFDPATNRNIRQIFALEGAMFRDAQFLLDRAREVHKGIEDFRKRSEEDQYALLTYLHSTTAATFHFLEAYLNGLAYDCFQLYHDELSLKEHDLLGEWDSKQKRQRYATFETKLYRYPAIVAKMSGRTLDLSASKAARFLIKDGKRVRDALTHPSPYTYPHAREYPKLSLVASLGLPFVEKLHEAAKEYILVVEKGLGKDPKKTIPWFFTR